MKVGEPVLACDVRFLPIVSAYARSLGLVEEVDRLCGSKRGVSDGQVVLALVLDALSGRSPLFRLPQAFAKLDTELLLVTTRRPRMRPPKKDPVSGPGLTPPDRILLSMKGRETASIVPPLHRQISIA